MFDPPKKRGRKPKDSDTLRVSLSARVAPETLEWIAAVAADRGWSHGRVIDWLVQHVPDMLQ